MGNNDIRENKIAGLMALEDVDEGEYGYTTQDVERARRRRERIAEMKRQKERQLRRRRLAVPVVFAAILCVVIGAAILKLAAGKHKTGNVGYTQEVVWEKMSETETKPEREEDEGKMGEIILAADVNLACADVMLPFSAIEGKQIAFIEENGFATLGGKSMESVLVAQSDENTIGSVGDAVSENLIFIDVEQRRILAQQGAKMRISPASMTKILTVLVAAEHIKDIDDSFEITIDITDYSYVHGCMNAGFEVGERVTVEDLFYGTVLPSGADAAVGLAKYVAGSQEEFVKLMNEKLDELGLSETSHFTNCVGVYDDNHYSTVYDMAVIMKAAYDNKFCRKVLSEHMYTTSSTPQHPDGIVLSNLFLRRIEDRDTHGEVLCAKTGYVDQSGSCAASLSVGNDGKLYICVSAHATSSWRCIRDHVEFYQHFLS